MYFHYYWLKLSCFQSSFIVDDIEYICDDDVLDFGHENTIICPQSFIINFLNYINTLGILPMSLISINDNFDINVIGYVQINVFLADNYDSAFLSMNIYLSLVWT